MLSVIIQMRPFGNESELDLENLLIKDISHGESLSVTKSGKKIPVFVSGRVLNIDGEDYLIGLIADISELSTARNKIAEQLNEIAKLNELL